MAMFGRSWRADDFAGTFQARVLILSLDAKCEVNLTMLRPVRVTRSLRFAQDLEAVVVINTWPRGSKVFCVTKLAGLMPPLKHRATAGCPPLCLGFL